MKGRLFVLLLTIGVARVCVADVTNPPDEARVAAARQLMHIVHADETAPAIIDAVYAKSRKDHPQVPDAFWDEYRAAFTPEHLVDLMARIWARQFSLDELHELSAFYQTPTGHKFLEMNWRMLHETSSSPEFIEWLGQIRENIVKRLTEQCLANTGNPNTPCAFKPDPASGQATSPAMDYDLPPRPVKTTKPEYPPDAFAQKLEGKVVVEVLIDTTGHVARARVVESAPPFDEAALQCVHEWEFTPAMKHGRPVATLAHIPVLFRIY